MKEKLFKNLRDEFCGVSQTLPKSEIHTYRRKYKAWLLLEWKKTMFSVKLVQFLQLSLATIFYYRYKGQGGWPHHRPFLISLRIWSLGALTPANWIWPVFQIQFWPEVRTLEHLNKSKNQGQRYSSVGQTLALHATDLDSNHSTAGGPLLIFEQ